MTKTLDRDFLRTMYLLSDDMVGGTEHKYFVPDMSAVLDLEERGYVKRIDNYVEDKPTKFCLTQEGRDYYKKIMNFASEEF